MLVMQSRDNAISFRARKRRFGRGYRLAPSERRQTSQPTYIDIGNRDCPLARRAHRWNRQSNPPKPSATSDNAHLLGVTAIGTDPTRGVVDKNPERLRLPGT